ncbi:unnamed protein product [Lathyrus oleraceus]
MRSGRGLDKYQMDSTLHTPQEHSLRKLIHWLTQPVKVLFVSELRHDILVEAIGTTKHGARVRGLEMAFA